VTMKQIGAEIGVNESRVSQLHERAIRRLREAFGDKNRQHVAEMRRQLIAFAVKPKMAKAETVQAATSSGVVLPYKWVAKRAVQARALKVRRTGHAVAAAR